MTPNNPNFGLDLDQRMTPSVARFLALLDMVNQSLRVAMPAVVQSFSPGPPALVSVVLATNEFVTQNGSGAGINLDTTAQQIRLIQDLPVVPMGGGGWSLTFPIQPGDECLVVFADTPIDVWLQNGGINNNPINQRRHDLSDGFAIIGPRSTPNGISGWSTDSVQLRSADGSVIIDLKGTQITITAPNVVVNASDQVTITGNTSVTIGDNTIIDGHVFLDHAHGGVMGGGSVTGPVV